MKKSESEVAQSCLTLSDPVDCSLPRSSDHRIFQAIVLEWIATSFSKGSSRPRDRTRVSRIVDRRFTVWSWQQMKKQGNYLCVKLLVTQSCLTLYDPVGHSPPGSFIHRILQARILEWVAFPFSRVSSQPRNWTRVSCIAGRSFTVWASGSLPLCS